MKKGLSILVITGILFIIQSCGEKQPASPPATATGSIKNAKITINYAQVGVKGRTIWGELVPYNEVWRTGADAATTFEVDKDVMVQEQILPAGKYSMFTIPKEGEWTVIFNETWDQWGAYDYDASKDVLRVTASPSVLEEPVERLTFVVEGDHVVFTWEKLKLALKVTEMPASPPAVAEATIGSSKVTINYCQPSMKGRTIWGELVPYDKVWRTGANAATTIEFSEATKIEGSPIAAGKYALFTVPTEKDGWTLIFNSKHDQWGAYDYQQDLDVLRVKVTPETGQPSMERMTFDIKDGKVSLAWSDMKVGFNVGD